MYNMSNKLPEIKTAWSESKHRVKSPEKIFRYNPMEHNIHNKSAIENAAKMKEERETRSKLGLLPKKKESTHLPLFEKSKSQTLATRRNSSNSHSVANELSDFDEESEPIPRRLPPIRGRTSTRSPKSPKSPNLPPQTGGKRNRKSRSNRARKNRTSKK